MKRYNFKYYPHRNVFGLGRYSIPVITENGSNLAPFQVIDRLNKLHEQVYGKNKIQFHYCGKENIKPYPRLLCSMHRGYAEDEDTTFDAIKEIERLRRYEVEYNKLTSLDQEYVIPKTKDNVLLHLIESDDGPYIIHNNTIIECDNIYKSNGQWWVSYEAPAGCKCCYNPYNKLFSECYAYKSNAKESLDADN